MQTQKLTVEEKKNPFINFPSGVMGCWTVRKAILECPLLYDRDNCSGLDADCFGNGDKIYGCHTLMDYLVGQFDKAERGERTEMSKRKLNNWRPYYNTFIQETEKGKLEDSLED